MPSISLVIPTIQSRRHWLRKILPVFCETTDDAECIIVYDAPTCNEAWNIGMKEASGDYILLAADDIEPHRGWIGEAIHWANSGILPCPRILNGDGSLQSCGDYATETPTGSSSDVCRVPFLKREWLEWAYPVPGQMHYMGDYWISKKGSQNGVPTQVVREIVFTHYMAREGRLERLDKDVKMYRRLK